MGRRAAAGEWEALLDEYALPSPSPLLASPRLASPGLPTWSLLQPVLPTYLPRVVWCVADYYFSQYVSSSFRFVSFRSVRSICLFFFSARFACLVLSCLLVVVVVSSRYRSIVRRVVLCCVGWFLDLLDC